jgi:hypothetical protein
MTVTALAQSTLGGASSARAITGPTSNPAASQTHLQPKVVIFVPCRRAIR